MTKEHVKHQSIVRFAEEYVNLRRSDAEKYRTQVRTMREKLENRLRENSNYELRKMRLSGSLAKGTSLKQLNDIDVAVYVQQDNLPQEMPSFLEKLLDIMRNLYPNMDPSQITKQEHSICMSFRGTGLDVDIVPISYNGNKEWDGYLYSARTGRWVLTNISKHIEFIKKRKATHPNDFAQIVRLLKYWVKNIKKHNADFKFKSFLVELILAHLADNNKIKFDDYTESLINFFDFIVKRGLDTTIVFSDYYAPSKIAHGTEPLCIFDPVNPENNAAANYQQHDKDMIIKVAADAADAIDSANYATTKSETIRYWQKVFGSSFGG